MAGDLPVKVRITLLDAFSEPLKRMKGAIGDVKESFKGVRETFRTAGDLKLAGDNVRQFGSLILGVLKGPVDEFKAFEKQMSVVSAVGEITGESLDKLRKQAIRLGADTQYSATEAAQAQENLVSAGFNVNEVMQMTPVALNMAAAGNLSLAESSKILAGTMRSFGKDASMTAKVADTLASAAALSSADIEAVSISMSRAGPLARKLGIDMSSVAAAASVFANNNIDAAEGATALRNILTLMVAPGKHAEAAFRSIKMGKKDVEGLKTELGKGNLLGALQTIGTQFEKLGTTAPKQIEILTRVFGREVAAQAQILIGASLDKGSGGFADLEAAYAKAQGATARMAQTMGANLAGELERTGGAISELSLKIGERMKPAIMQLAAAVQGAVSAVAGWIDKNPELANTLVRLTALVGAGAFVISGLTTVLGTAITTYGLLKGAVIAVRGAMIVTTAATNGVAVATFSKLIPSFVAARLAAISTSAAFVAMSSSKLGIAGMIVGAAALGYTVGRLISNWLDLDRKLSNTIGWIMGVDLEKGGRATERGMGNGDQVFGDGSVIGADGTVKKVGDGPAELAPGIVKRGRAKGLLTPEAINEAAAKRETPMGPPVPPGGIPGDPATKEQTKVLDEHNREQTKVLREVRDELRRRRPPAATPAPADF